MLSNGCVGPTPMEMGSRWSDELKLVGPKALTKDVSSWMEISVFAGIAPASEI